jgi:hypothetical protein
VIPVVSDELLPELGALPSRASAGRVRQHQPARRAAVSFGQMALRVLLGFYLAMRALLIPGEAGRLVATPLTWADVLPPMYGQGLADGRQACAGEAGGETRRASVSGGTSSRCDVEGRHQATRPRSPRP